ncbi:tyrosine-type recombinase/integrase [Actinophytocola sp.]|uniref:tyrosine-type recombinase/integrase n=1 Tax=Actinophytocola sp. TaxID=1872138 RepID=UPI003899ACA4
MARDKTPDRVNPGAALVRRGARGSISRLPSGSLRVRVYAGTNPVTGRPRTLTQTIPDGPTALDDAEAVCRRLVDRVRDQRQPRTDITLSELLDRHLALVHASDTTRRSYRYAVAKHVQPLLGHLGLAAITPEVLDFFYAELRRCRDHCRRPQDGHRCRPLAPPTVRKIHYLVSGAYRRAVRWGWIDRSPTPDADPPPAPPPEPQPPTPAEAARILSAAWTDPDLGPLVWLAMVTGARRGELCALRWRHLDLTRRTVVIRASIAQSGVDTWEKDTKLHQRRHLALDPHTTALLTAYHQARQHRAALVGATLTPDSFVFSPRADAATWRPPAALGRQYGLLVAELGIRTTLHKLRHYSATELITAGVDLRTVAGRLGHAGGGRSTLAYYTAWVDEADQRASRILMHRLPVPRAPLATRPAPTSRPASPYQAIAAELRTAIRNGTLPPGTPLPTVQQLAATHHVAPSTAHRAIALLAREHRITVTRGRRGIVQPAASSS